MPGLRHAMSRGASRWMGALGMSAPALLLAAWCGAASLRQGDVVLTHNTNGSTLIVLLDPATLDTTLVSYGYGTIATYAVGVAVDRSGRILVADWYTGIVRVDAATGSQSVLASPARLGGQPGGIFVAPLGDLFVSVRGSTPGVVRVSTDGSTVTPLTSGDRISAPGGLALGPDGALYVAEEYLPHDNGEADGVPGHGSIVRVDPVTGDQTLVAADSVFLGPFAIALVAPDLVWTAQRGYIAGRRGCFIETRLSDGHSARANATSSCRSQGIAVAADGTVYVSDCSTIGPDCATLYTTRLPSGPTLWGFGGPMAVVPDLPVPARRASWGALKTIFRWTDVKVWPRNRTTRSSGNLRLSRALALLVSEGI